MRALALMALIPVVLWACQSVLLLRAGRPLAWRISSADMPESFKRINRVATYAALLGVMIAYPLWRRFHPLHYYAKYLPTGDAAWGFAYGAGGAMLYLTLLYLAWLLSGNVHFEIRHKRSKLIRRLAGVPFTAILVAFVEEIIFRAMLLNDLLDTLPLLAAIAIGAIVFAGAHYVRSVKRYWTLPGHLALGVLFCVAFHCTGTLWLPIGLHFGGVLVLMAARPFVRYTGPAWLVGASIFPFASVAGVIALVLLTLNIYLTYGAAS